MKRHLVQEGFTLVKLTIAMIIIGLLVVAVLKGQAMIDDSKQTRMLNDIQAISIAFYTYYDRYGSIPGDDATANARWTNIANGDGNGFISGTAVPSPTGESQEAWKALRYSGLLSGHPSRTGLESLTEHPYGGRYGLSKRNFGGTIGLKNYIYVDNISGSAGELVDIKCDDGIYDTGTVQADAAYTTATVDLYYAL